MARGALAVLAVLPVLLASGCSDVEPAVRPIPPSPPIYLPRTIPEYVLKNVETALSSRDIDGYAAQIHPQFKFIASPFDDEGWYDWLESVESSRRMLDGVDNIEVALANDGATPSEYPEVEYGAETGHRQILVPSAFLKIQTRRMQGGEPVFLQAPGRPHLLVFRPDSTGYPADPVTWSIVVWQDQNTAGNAARAGALVADAGAGLRPPLPIAPFVALMRTRVGSCDASRCGERASRTSLPGKLADRRRCAFLVRAESPS